MWSDSVFLYILYLGIRICSVDEVFGICCLSQNEIPIMFSECGWVGGWWFWHSWFSTQFTGNQIVTALLARWSTSQDDHNEKKTRTKNRQKQQNNQSDCTPWSTYPYIDEHDNEDEDGWYSWVAYDENYDYLSGSGGWAILKGCWWWSSWSSLSSWSSWSYIRIWKTADTQGLLT